MSVFWGLPASAKSQVHVVNMIPASLSYESGQDSAPMLAVNPSYPRRMISSVLSSMAIAPGSGDMPLFLSMDNGKSWVVNTVSLTQKNQSGLIYTGIAPGGDLNQIYLSGLNPSLAFPGEVLKIPNVIEPEEAKSLLKGEHIGHPSIKTFSNRMTDVVKFDVAPSGKHRLGVWVGLSQGDKFSAEKWGTCPIDKCLKVLSGDFNGDGKTDVLKIHIPTTVDGKITLWVGISDGKKFNMSQWGVVESSQDKKMLYRLYNYVAGKVKGQYKGQDLKYLSGDFNADGWEDIAIIDVPPFGATTANIWVGISDGKSFKLEPWGSWPAYKEMKVLAGDFNGDGKTDIMKFDVPSEGSKETGLWVGLSDGKQFQLKKWAAAEMSREMKVLAGDFNGDGKTDIMKFDVRSSGPARLGLWVGLSTGSRFDMSRWATWQTDMYMKVLAGDFNGDGKTDVMKFDVPPKGHDRLGLWVGLSNGKQFQTSRWAIWQTDKYMKVLAGDFNGDGKTDVMKFDIPPEGVEQKGIWVGLSDGTRFHTSQWGSWNASHEMRYLAGNFDGSTDAVIVGHNDYNAAEGKTASISVSLDNGKTFRPIHIESRSTPGQDGPLVKTTVSRDGTVYAAFFGWRRFDGNEVVSDVVVVRDDLGGKGIRPFQALIDPDDRMVGTRVVKDIRVPLPGREALGNQRIGSDLAIAVDPNNSSTVYIAWADKTESKYVLHVRKSTDRGLSWSKDLQTIPNAINVALAVAENGTVGLFYQEFIDLETENDRWITHLKQCRKSFEEITDIVLANVPANGPETEFQPYLGGFGSLVVVGNEFRGVFSASNMPDKDNFPEGVTYQRHVDFSAHTILDREGNVVPVSVDPFYFSALVEE